MSTRSKKNKKFEKIIRCSVFALAVIMLITSALMFMRAWEKNRGVYNGDDISSSSETVYNGKEYVLKDDIETFLVLGLDKFDGFKAVESYNNDMQADFLMLFVFDDEAKKCTAVHINRDTMVDINVLGVAGNKINTVTQQIALAHTYGNGRDVSCRNTANSVSKLLGGIKVNHYISLTMDSVRIINDSIGGVKVKVLSDFSGIDDTLKKGESVTLKGEQALLYVRSRQGLNDSSNTDRMKRQRQYIEAFYNKAVKMAEENTDFAVNALKDLSEYIVSDRSIAQMQELADKFIGYDFEGIRVIEGDNLTGEKYMEFYADEKSVNEIVFDLFYKVKTK